MVTARELSLEEIREIREHIPRIWKLKPLFTGQCVFPIQAVVFSAIIWWEEMPTEAPAPIRAGGKYSIVEEKRPGEYMPVFENERGTYIFNSKDLCMIEHMDDVLTSGIDSLED